MGRKLSRFVVLSVTVLSLVVGGLLPSMPVAKVAAEPPVTTPAQNGKIAYEKGGDIFTVDPSGANRVKLTDSGITHYPAWSPDGTKIAYIREYSGDFHDLWLMNADGSKKTQVTSNAEIIGGPAWSPDGMKLAFAGKCMVTDSRPDLCDFKDNTLNTISSVKPFGVPKTVKACYVGAGYTGCPPKFAIYDVTSKVAWSSTDIIAMYSKDFPYRSDDYMITYAFADDGIRIFDEVNHSCCGSGYFANPAFSPDGSLLAYEEVKEYYWGEEAYGIDMCHHPWDGVCELFVRVQGDKGLVFAPDSSKVVLSNGGMLITANTDGTSRQNLVNGKNPSWQAL